MSKAKKRVSKIGTVGAFINGRACSDTLCHVLNRAFDEPKGLFKQQTGDDSAPCWSRYDCS